MSRALAMLLISSAALAQPVPDPVREKPPTAPEPLTPPRLLEQAQPIYPAGAQGAARVVVQLDVDAQGLPQHLMVISPAQPGFDEAALAAAQKLRFDPARRGTEPIPVRIQSAFNFVPPVRERPPLPLLEEPVNLTGQVRERGTRRKLFGIEVTAGDHSALTDRDGRFALRGLPEETPIGIVIAAPGYLRFTARETIPRGQALNVEYRLQPELANPYEATVEGERERREISRTTLSRQETDRVPGAQGDAVKIVEDLPGVARTSPIGGGLLVIRGSKPGDSLVYLDGEPIPLLFHFGALSSTFNPDLLEAIDYIPGNFSASYGDLTGGLVEVRTRKLRDEPHGYANLNLLETSGLVEGSPVPGLTVALAGRRSYIDVILRAVVPKNGDVGLTVAPNYHDAQFRLDYRPPGSAHQLSLLALTSDDAIGLLVERPTAQDPNLSGSIDAETGFQQLRLKHEWRQDSASITTVAMFEKLLIRFLVGPSHFSLLGHDLFLRSTGAWKMSDRLGVSAGIDVANRRAVVGAVFRQSFLFREGDYNQQGPRPDDATISLQPAFYDRFSPGAWVEARYRILPNLVLTPGLRADLYRYGPRESNTTGTVTPRLSARWDLTEMVSLKGGLGMYSEGARNGDAARPFGNPAILPERAWQATLGVEARPLPGVFASAESFYKRLSDLIVKTDALETVNGVARPELLDNAGAGRVFGLELLVRKELSERFFGWIAYTLSRSDRIDRPGRPRRLFDFDQTHNLTAIASYRIGANWQLGARYRIISGNPDTPVVGSRYLANFDAYLPIYGGINSRRLPPFSQLDVRLDKTWTFDSWMLDAYVDVLNAYNHRSIEGSVYSYDFSQHAYFRGLPIIPTLGLKGSF